MKKPMNLIFVLALVGVLAGAAFAQFAKTEDAIKYRQSVMSVIGTHFSLMGAVVKGEAPYAKEAFEQNANIVAMLMPLSWDAFMVAGSDKAREINRMIKEKGPKGVSSQTQGETVRVTGKKRDDLQAVIALVVAFGLSLAPDQIGAIVAVTAVILGLITRSRVTPVS